MGFQFDMEQIKNTRPGRTIEQDLAFAISMALMQAKQPKKKSKDELPHVHEMRRKSLAEAIALHILRSGFEITRKPLGRAHSTKWKPTDDGAS